MRHSDKHTYNIRIEKQMKHWRQTLAIYVYNHFNICNIQSTFATSVRTTYNIPLKHLKHLKCTLATCIISRCCLLRYQHRRRGRRVYVSRPGASPYIGGAYRRHRTGRVRSTGRSNGRDGRGGLLGWSASTEKRCPDRADTLHAAFPIY
jgi:hypothetical protein